MTDTQRSVWQGGKTLKTRSTRGCGHGEVEWPLSLRVGRFFLRRGPADPCLWDHTMTRIILRRCDIDREPYKASGPGGQHKNKTETAIRLRHRPTGIVAQSASERSQRTNYESAWRLLQAKLDRMVQEQAAQEKRRRHGDKPRATFGSQIRSYFLDGPMPRVIDHRTGVQITVGEWAKGKIDPLLCARG